MKLSFLLLATLSCLALGSFGQGSCSWSPLGSGVPGLFAVRVLTVFDDGTGPALYVGGNFTQAGGVSANYIARWDGAALSPLGTGMSSGVNELTVFDDGIGPALYAGGWFTAAGGVATSSIARRNCGSTISVSQTQPGGPGSPVFLANTNLMPNHEYYNIFSFDQCPGGAGTGPFGGLCVSSPANHQFVLTQLTWPLGSSLLPLFHFIAPSNYVSWGALTLPPITLEAITFDLTGGVLGPISQVATITIQ